MGFPQDLGIQQNKMFHKVLGIPVTGMSTKKTFKISHTVEFPATDTENAGERGMGQASIQAGDKVKFDKNH